MERAETDGTRRTAPAGEGGYHGDRDARVIGARRSEELEIWKIGLLSENAYPGSSP